MNAQPYRTTNYMVPSNGQTHCVEYTGTFSANPFTIDWRQYTVDNSMFQPQGVFIDNTNGTVPLVITILPINYNVTCPAGQVLSAQFPAPNGQSASIVGDPANNASVYFVDFPVLPGGSTVNVAGTANVNIVGSTAVVRVDPNPLAAGNTLPYRTQEYVSLATQTSFSILAGATTNNVAPAANSNLRKLVITTTTNATLAVAAENVLTITLNGVNVFVARFFFPAAAIANDIGSLILYDEDFNVAALNTGAAGTLVATWSTAFATGSTNVNAYFSPQ